MAFYGILSLLQHAIADRRGRHVVPSAHSEARARCMQEDSPAEHLGRCNSCVQRFCAVRAEHLDMDWRMRVLRHASTGIRRCIFELEQHRPEAMSVGQVRS